jgi:DNA-binding NtrC family response regulator
MGRVTVATTDEDLRRSLVALLTGAGLPVDSAASWEGLLGRASSPRCTLVLVDARLPKLVPDLLAALVNSLAHQPQIRVLKGAAGSLAHAPTRQQDLLRLARKTTKSGIDGDRRKELRLLGVGSETFVVLGRLAAASFPILIQGERGLGKQRLAWALHQISGDEGPFQVLDDNLDWEPEDGPAGTVYVDRLDEREPSEITELSRRTRANAWRLTAGARRPAPAITDQRTWNHLKLIPQRDRPEELRALTLHYLDRYRRQLGLPRRRFHRSLWALVMSYRWPGNARELETFVVQTLTSTRDSVIRADALPEPVRRLVDPAPDTHVLDLAEAFELVVEGRLRALVQQIDEDSGIEVRRLAVEATERALYRLALARTGGNQQAAAKLLGVARNTLRSRAAALGVLRS